jgi:hypothetical protein
MDEDGKQLLKQQYEHTLNDIEKAYNRNCDRLKKLKREISQDMVDIDELMAHTAKILTENPPDEPKTKLSEQ